MTIKIRYLANSVEPNTGEAWLIAQPMQESELSKGEVYPFRDVPPPSGNIHLYALNPEAVAHFTPGQSYYATFTPADPDPGPLTPPRSVPESEPITPQPLAKPAQTPPETPIDQQLDFSGSQVSEAKGGEELEGDKPEQIKE